MPVFAICQPGLPRSAVPAHRLIVWSAIGLVAAALTGCDRRPGDPPKPSTQLGVTPATAGLASLSGTPDSAVAAISPASDPPPTPIPRPSEPPASPASR